MKFRSEFVTNSSSSSFIYASSRQKVIRRFPVGVAEKLTETEQNQLVDFIWEQASVYKMKIGDIADTFYRAFSQERLDKIKKDHPKLYQVLCVDTHSNFGRKPTPWINYFDQPKKIEDEDTEDLRNLSIDELVNILAEMVENSNYDWCFIEWSPDSGNQPVGLDDDYIYANC